MDDEKRRGKKKRHAHPNTARQVDGHKVESIVHAQAVKHKGNDTVQQHARHCRRQGSEAGAAEAAKGGTEQARKGEEVHTSNDKGAPRVDEPQARSDGHQAGP